MLRSSLRLPRMYSELNCSGENRANHCSISQPISGTFRVDNQHPDANREHDSVQCHIDKSVWNLCIRLKFHWDISLYGFARELSKVGGQQVFSALSRHASRAFYSNRKASANDGVDWAALRRAVTEAGTRASVRTAASACQFRMSPR
jgi:hypothetical protein